MNSVALSGIPMLLANPMVIVFLVLLLAGLIGFYWYVYRVEGRRLTARQRRLLWVIRFLAAGLVLLMLANPALNIVRSEERLPVVGIVLDESRSMSFPDERDDELTRGLPKDQRTRYEGAKKAVQILQEKLSRTHRVKVYTVSDDLRKLKDVPHRTSDRERPLSIQEVVGDTPPTGEYSNLDDGLGAAAGELNPYEISGIVLATDARITGVDTEECQRRWAEISQAIAGGRTIGRKVPVHALGFGADHPLRDLRIDEVTVPTEASLGDLLPFQLTVTNYIRDNLTVDLMLLENGKEVRKSRIYWPRMGSQRIVVHTIPDIEGEREFKFVLPEYDDEFSKDNNTATVSVKVIRRGLRALLVAGQPSLEYHYLVPALLRDPIVKVSCFLQSADVDYIQQGNSGIDRLPRTTKEWDEFDVVILMDVDPKRVSSQQVSGLENLVRKGGGLLFLAGRNFGFDTLLQVHPTKLTEMVPVKIDKNRHPDYVNLFPRAFRGNRTPEGTKHPILVCSPDGAANEHIWTSFPQFFWRHPVVDKKPGTVVLLEGRPVDGPADEGSVLMALSRYGEGAVFYSGVNTVWRWRYPCESYDYDRFWTRVIRYLGETKLLGAQKQVALSTDKQVYSPGEDVRITLSILDAALMEQLRDERVYATVTGAGGERLAVELERDPKGLLEYHGTYTARHLGRGQVHATHVSSKADSQGKSLFDVKCAFDVKLRSLEELDTSADLESLQLLAEKTGGTYLDYHTVSQTSLEQLAKSIPTKPQVVTERQIVEIWDGLAVLIIFLVLVSLEWSLRKLWGVL